MLRLFHAGLAAACFQFVTVLPVTLIVFLSARHGLIVPASMSSKLDSDAEDLLASISPLLTPLYLLTALGFALTNNRFVEFTAARIRHASSLMRPIEPEHAAKALMVHLFLVATGFVVLALSPPADLLIRAGHYFGCNAAASIAWPGMMSVGVASFGANAQAARKAFSHSA